MFHGNYDITNKSYSDRVRKGYKVNKDLEQKENKHQRNKKQENEENGSNKNKKSIENSDKGNNLDFYA